MWRPVYKSRYLTIFCTLCLVTSLGCQVHVAIGPKSKSQKNLVQSIDLDENADIANQDVPQPVNVEDKPSVTSLPTPPTPYSIKQVSESSSKQPNSGNVVPAVDSQPESQLSQLKPGENEQVDFVRSPVPAPAAEEPGNELLPEGTLDADNRYPVDLSTALQLAGANNLQIALAAERVYEAQARLESAEVLWIPSISAGVGYNKHEGRIQGTEGIVRDVSRNSLFVGGGLGLSAAPLTGGSSGPARMFVDISPVDIYFEPLAARQSKEAARAQEVVTFNDTLLKVTMTYLELVRSQFQAAIAEEAVSNSKKLVSLTEEFSRTGARMEADAIRARADLANRHRDVLLANEWVNVVATELARLLRLDQNTSLFAVESQPVKWMIVSEETPLEQLVAQALSSRPELSEHQALVAETLHRMRKEKWRPWVPNVHLGASAGGFGGGRGSHQGSFNDRGDFDALAIWEIRNLGLGNRALQRERSSQHRQVHLAYTQVQDRIIAEVTRAYREIQSRKEQIKQAQIQVNSASAAIPLNFNGIRGRELRAIEAQQAIAALALARSGYLSSIIDYNLSQFALLRALGKPPESVVSAE